VLSGGTPLRGLEWRAATRAGVARGVLVASAGAQLPADARTAAWRARGARAATRAGPPPLVSSLFIDGARAVRARWPNGNPRETGGQCIASKARFANEGCEAWSTCITSVPRQQDAPPRAYRLDGVSPNRGNSSTQGCGAPCFQCGSFGYSIYPPPADHPVYDAPLPGVGWPNASVFSPFGSPFSRAGAAVVATDATPDGADKSCAHWARAATYAPPSAPIMHMFHNMLWGGWSFALDNVTAAPDNKSATFNIGYGGYQEARGAAGGSGQRFYVENALEELDAPGEWFYDAAAGDLYLLPNSTRAELDAALLVVPLLDAVVVVNGSQSARGAYARGISFTGFTIAHSRTTFLEQFEVPSGGDWAVHRGGALFVQDAEDVSVAGCLINQPGGNGIVFSNHVWRSNITDTEIVGAGESAVIFIGSTVGADGSAPTYPNHNLLARNHMHEIGLFVKQSSCLGQQLTANSTIVDNVCYNGPRAGYNFNDGFGGGHVFEHNVVWNMVRETKDHGPLNSWDRQPYWTLSGVDDGFADPAGRSFIKAWDANTHNLVLNFYNGVWAFDHDDCSQFVRDDDNFMFLGGCKNNRGSHKNCSSNVILYPGAFSGHACQTDDNGVFGDQFHESNVCSSSDGTYYSIPSCTPATVNTTVYMTRNNTLLADAGVVFSQGCHGPLTFAAWQALGQDAGSHTAATPDVDALLALGAAKVM